MPLTAEDLMRSRYTAYTLGHESYLLATWHHSSRPKSLELANQPAHKWLGLTIKHHKQNAPDEAMVEFVARYKVNGRARRLHETSRFVKTGKQWFYIDGEII